MRPNAAKIVSMKPRHVRSCNAIVASSDPWRTLGEGPHFPWCISRKEAYVCVVDGEVAGFIVFTPDPVFARGGYLRAIGVAPAMRKRGIGRRLLSFAETLTARRSPNFYLCVSSFNRTAQAFYRSLGYTRVGKLPGLIIPGASEYIFWKRLKNRAVSSEPLP